MKLDKVRKYLETRIIGQKSLIDNMLVCLLAGGHLLIEGMPGLAKTSASKYLAEAVNSNFKRIQFTPDLLPSDITGSDIYIKEKNSFEFCAGPIFNNIILADEINRAPAKVQSALLEAMGEGQVSVGLETRKLPDLFMVIATQNPIDQEGTYNLPEAQLDRFLMKSVITYPLPSEELEILRLATNSKNSETKLNKANAITTIPEILEARALANEIFVDAKIEKYIVSLVTCTRNPTDFSSDLANLIRFGASPRASIALMKCAKAFAYLEGSEFVAPHHVQAIAYEVLRHRILPSFEAEADNISNDDIIDRVLQVVAVG
ncbi:MAG: MoxR family ATPase [Rickettsiales bacterium]|nr:MoxR family ATPase [Rickettsiales bacterium]